MNWIDDILNTVKKEAVGGTIPYIPNQEFNFKKDNSPSRDSEHFNHLMEIWLDVQVFLFRYDLLLTDTSEWVKDYSAILVDMISKVGSIITLPQDILENILSAKSIKEINTDSTEQYQKMKIAGTILFTLVRMHLSGKTPTINQCVYHMSSVCNMSERKIFTYWKKYKNISHILAVDQMMDIKRIINVYSEEQLDKQTSVMLFSEFYRRYIILMYDFYIFGSSKTDGKVDPFIDYRLAWLVRPKRAMKALLPDTFSQMEKLQKQSDEELATDMTKEKFDPVLFDSESLLLNASDIDIIKKYRAPKKI